MSESRLGVSVAATRQNSGSALYRLAAPPPFCCPPGGENCPAATVRADVICASLRTSVASLSHGAANAGAAHTQATAHVAPTNRELIIGSFALPSVLHSAMV